MHRRTFTKALLALGLCGSMLGGFTASVRAQERKPKEDDVKKMEAALPDKAPAKPEKARKLLIYGNANGYVHSSIPLGEETIKELGAKTGAWTGTISNDPAAFDDLSGYDGVMLVSTTGHFLIPQANAGKAPGKDATDEQKKAYEAKKKEADAKLAPYKEAEKKRMQNLIDFVEKDGKGLAGIHAATDAYYDNRPYGDLIGGYFAGHHAGQEKIAVVNEDPKSAITAPFDGKGFDFADEIYRFTPKGKDGKDQSYSREKVHVLLSVDVTKNNNEKAGTDMPVSWIHKAGKGRVFYCSLGHNEFVYENPTILKYYLAGIQYALGDLQANDAPSSPKSASAK